MRATIEFIRYIAGMQFLDYIDILINAILKNKILNVTLINFAVIKTMQMLITVSACEFGMVAGVR